MGWQLWHFPEGRDLRDGWDFSTKLDMTLWAWDVYWWLHLQDISRNEDAAT